MCLNTEIDRTINRLATVFMSKNIPVMPISEIGYFDSIDESSGLYVLELIMQLDNLLGVYGLKNRIPHQKERYSKVFKELYLENVEDGNILPRPKRK